MAQLNRLEAYQQELIDNEWQRGNECVARQSMNWSVIKPPSRVLHQGSMDHFFFITKCGLWIQRVSAFAVPAGRGPGFRPADGTLCQKCHPEAWKGYR